MKISEFIKKLEEVMERDGDLDVVFEDHYDYVTDPNDLEKAENYDTYWQLKETAKFVNHVRPPTSDYDRIKKECHFAEHDNYDLMLRDMNKKYGKDKTVGDIYISYIPNGTFYLSL